MAYQDLAPVNASDKFELLARSILDISPAPDDQYEVAAILESMGLTDGRVAEQYGATNVFDLASQLWPLVKAGTLAQAIEPPSHESIFTVLLKNLRNFLRGAMFAAPMIVSVFAMLTLRFSLWSYQYFSVDIATAIALGTILSFSVTGGFTQAIARRGLMYMSQQEYAMARRMTFMLIRLGVGISIVFGFLILLVDLVFPVFPPRMMLITVIYYAFLCAIWLSLTIFYMLQQELVFTLLVSLGIALVYVMHEIYGISIIPSQVTALTIVSFLNILAALNLFRRAERTQERDELIEMPRLSIVAYTVLPYFTYGLLYFVFLFIDRIMAWSAHDVYMPYVIWFRGEYELGLDFAMLALVIPLGIVETIVLRFSERLVTTQRTFTADRAGEFNERYKSVYKRSMVSYSIVAFLSSAVTYTVWMLINRYQWFAGTIRMSQLTIFVFTWAVVAYALLAAALLNCLILFSLSIPQPIVRSALTSLIVNVGLGFVLSRLVHYSYAIFGFVAGALVFVILTIRETLKVLGKLDFHMYASS